VKLVEIGSCCVFLIFRCISDYTLVGYVFLLVLDPIRG
jgi:hypothetical protein